jgi:predicted amidophosphoribosyltransferase
MKCPRCQHDNPQGARFCEECATPLAPAERVLSSGRRAEEDEASDGALADLKL